MEQVGDIGETLRHGPLLREEQAKGAAEIVHDVAVESPALEPDQVETRQAGAVAHGRAVRNDVVLDPGHAADDRVAPDADKLMHASEAADDGPVVHRHVAAQGRVVGHDDMVAHDAVMGDVGCDHEQAVAADLGQHAAMRRPRTHGHMLADHVV